MQKHIFKNRILFLSLIIILANSPKLMCQEVLNNQSIISLSQAKVSTDLIFEKIKTSKNTFRLTTQGILELVYARINDRIIDAMLLASTDLPLMRNQDVIELFGNKVSRNIIIKKIQYSENEFDTTTDALIKLKQYNIPDQLVKMIINPTKTMQQNGNPNQITGILPAHIQDFPTPNMDLFHEPGLYYEEYKYKNPKYNLIDPTTTNKTKNGTFGEAYLGAVTSGISSTKQRVGLNNPSANFVIEDNRPVFYMVFSGETRKDMNIVAENIFAGASSPNDFTLLKVKPNRRGREFTIGKQSSFTSETGFADGAVQFRFVRISNTLYKIYFEQDISAAEYAFFYNKGSEFVSSLKLYDFSLKNNMK